jgi:hypothetical protein
MVFAALWAGWIGWSRIRRRGFGRLPGWAGPALVAMGAALLASSAFAPRALLGPTEPASPTVAAGPRPRSTASIDFREPTSGDVVRGDDVEVVMDLAGGRVVDTSSSELSPDAGHIHLSLDGALVSMTYGNVQIVDLRGAPPGAHTLEAEFVAADHGPFDPRVTASITFDLERSG